MIQRTITDEILARSIGQIFEAEKLNLDLAKTILSRVASFVQDSNEFKTRPIRHMEALISNSGDRVLDLDWLAGEFCMSKYHFIRYFKQASGLTPQVYIMMRRLENAKQMLLKGIEIKDAAYTNGFYDPSHFTNTFKKYFGIKPSAAKKSNILQSGHL
jgi:AraC-like DNA-binding protein